ncbi:SRPBCC family protein [Dactylosporangium sp. CA-152071]|uniref:SRPBCC family protein n=1 Tax=Dactylosporangium sp. CA-152071 TaxID=3239933 RepID=UPI003D8BC60C
MARFSVTLDVAAPAGRVWAALVDWPRHGDWAPLTSVRVVTPRPDGIGATFVARSGIGRVGFDDPMTVAVWRPPAGDEPGDEPGRCDVDKSGRVIHGTAAFDVIPLPGGRSLVVWHEDVTVMPHALTRRFPLIVTAVGRIGFRRALRAMAREVERAPARTGGERQ